MKKLSLLEFQVTHSFIASLHCQLHESPRRGRLPESQLVTSGGLQGCLSGAVTLHASSTSFKGRLVRGNCTPGHLAGPQIQTHPSIHDLEFQRKWYPKFISTSCITGNMTLLILFSYGEKNKKGSHFLGIKEEIWPRARVLEPQV